MWFDRFARAANRFSASALATALVAGLIVVWALTGPHFRFSNTWQLVMNTLSSIITFLMVFIIANAQKRDTDALNLKLDLLIAANPAMSNKAVGIESASREDILEVQAEIAANVRQDPDSPMNGTP
ncbi:MAG TPA: low affinity iron permease family protein [Candidatus Dormibacteraeota bacterium]|nr:low affinity iron permease family protein [Candidatus Dormibacteraeota bacterium]